MFIISGEHKFGTETFGMESRVRKMPITSDPLNHGYRWSIIVFASCSFVVEYKFHFVFV